MTKKERAPKLNVIATSLYRLIAHLFLVVITDPIIHSLALEAVLDYPWMSLYILQADPLLRVKDQQLLTISATFTHVRNEYFLTRLIRSLASDETKEGIDISPRAIRFCVIMGVSSKGASPTRNS